MYMHNGGDRFTFCNIFIMLFSVGYAIMEIEQKEEISMKKFLLTAVILATVLSTATGVSAAQKTVSFSAAPVKSASGFSASGDEVSLNMGGYVGFSGVDLTGINSVIVKAKCSMPYGSNGETLVIVIDDPVNGDDIGYVIINSEGKNEFVGGIKKVDGVHDVYFVSSYGKNFYNKFVSAEFSPFPAPEGIKAVPEEKIRDNYSDTWASTDSYGRRVAGYAEAGPVKNGDHYVGIMYWDWFEKGEIQAPLIISEVIKEHPEAKDDYSNKAWGVSRSTYWDEPLLGFYKGSDYWVYRRHASWLSAAGVDFIYLDYTNDDNAYISNLNVLMRAFHDARDSGIDAPKISAYMGPPQKTAAQLKALWFNFLGNEEYSDLWFMFDGKPLVVAESRETISSYIDKENVRDRELLDKIYKSITIREPGSRQTGQKNGKNEWVWLENYPLHEWGKKRDDGRIEAMTVGISINHSYVYNYTYTGLASDEYTKGRAYTEGFGEGTDPRSAAFFREQASQVLDTDPAVVLIDGWNEFSAARQQNYAGFKNSFVDTFDSENSRDIEPVKGILKDDSYNLLADFIRKYKGVRPVPLSNGRKTIDIGSDVSQWDSVAPEYVNDYDAYERTEKGIGGMVYEGKTVNSIETVKAVRDDSSIYFYVKCRDVINRNTDEFLHVYINSDRNYATGWEGYDFAVNRRDGKIEKFENGAWTEAGKAEYSVSGDVLMLKADASILKIGAEFEFKWADSCGEIKSGDLLEFYKTGSAAPLGRFNYVYTEKEEKVLTGAERSRLYGTAVFKAGSDKMIISGGIMDVYEADNRITAFSQDGTLYIPATVFEEFMYGESKVRYDRGDNTLHLSCFDLEDLKIKDEVWTYLTLGGIEARVNGHLRQISHTAVALNGVIYIPVSIFSECFGFDVYSNGDVYAVSRYGKVETGVVEEVISHLD